MSDRRQDGNWYSTQAPGECKQQQQEEEGEGEGEDEDCWWRYVCLKVSLDFGLKKVPVVPRQAQDNRTARES